MMSEMASSVGVQDVTGIWFVAVGEPDNITRGMELQPGGRIQAGYGTEFFWTVSAGSLLLLSASRTIVSIFDLQAAVDGRVPGRLAGFDFDSVPIWMTRRGRPPSPAGSQQRPVHRGLLSNQVRDDNAFREAWRSGDDFTYVVFDGGLLPATAAVAESRNLGSTPQSQAHMDQMLRLFPAGFECLPVFFHVLNDGWIVDGSIAVTREGMVVQETTQFVSRGFKGPEDQDFLLTGSDWSEALNPTVFVDLPNRGNRIEAPTFWFNKINFSYGHWLVQSAANWLFLDLIGRADAPLASSLLLASTCGIDRERFRSETLRLLEVDNPILSLPKGAVQFRKLIVPSFHVSYSRHWPGMTVAWQKMGATAKKMHVGEAFPRRIYASRAGQSRNFMAAEAIDAVLGRHGFQPLIGGTMPLSQQVAAYAQAEAVFGAYGSNMCNISYCAPGARIIEAIDELHVDAVWEYFLANAGQMPFCVLIAPVSEGAKSLGYSERPCELPPEALDEALTHFLSRL